ncbi:tRNA pseudouridine(55) synthase TruB [Psychrobacter sp. ER1]|uniref:tRNA pseudouridine(55) synthase TruB n=1 Tax=Psychrobacter sp. ER1 TaxID=3406645 RepID=UPI003B42A967
MYEYARAGIEVDRPPRDITIKAINLQMIDDTQINLTVTCTKGTYVRVLAEDIAKQLGTLGHLTALRRTQVGNFSIDDAIALSSLEEHGLEERQFWLLPIDACIDIDAELTLTEEQCARVHMGQRLNVFDELTGKLKDYVASNAAYQISNASEAETNTVGTEDSIDISQPLEHELPIDIRLLNEQGEFLGLGSVSLNGRLQPKKLIQR